VENIIEKILNVVRLGIGSKVVFIAVSFFVLWLSLHIFKKYANNRLCRMAAGVVFGITVAVLLIWFLKGWGILLMLLVGFVVYIPFWFTIVKEGTGKIVNKMGAYHKILIQWENRTISKKVAKDLNNKITIDVDDVVSGEEHHILGGIRYKGPPPFYTLDSHSFSWTSVKPDGTFEVHDKESHDYFLFKDDVYGCKIIGAEDKNKIPLDINLIITAAIVNAIKARFNVQNWYETMMSRIYPYVRDCITKHTFDELIKTDIRIDKIIWDRLIEEGIIAEFYDRYGVKIRKIEVRNFDPQREYRELTLREYDAEKDAGARTQKTTGALMRMIAQVTGKRIEDIQKEIELDSSAKEKFINMCSDLLARQMAIDGKSFFDIRYGGPDGMSAILSTIATALGMSRGKNSLTSSPATVDDLKKKEKKKKKIDDMDPTELEEAWQAEQEDKKQV